MLMLPFMASAQEEGLLSASAGVKYATGKYGTDSDINTLTLPVTVGYIRGAWSLSATLSYMQVQSDGNVTVTSGGVVTSTKSGGKSGSGTSTVSGMGDTLIEGGYTLFPADLLMVKFGGIAKIATADEAQGLGTGEHDYSLQVSVFKTLDALSVSGYAGYTMTGDSDLVTYNDIFYGSAGMSYRLSRPFSIGGSLYYAEAISDGLDPLQHVSVFSNWSLSSTNTVGLTYAHGLSDAAADHAVNIIFSRYF